MKLKNKEVVTMYYGLLSLAEDKAIKLPARVAYVIIKNMKTLEKIVLAVEATRLNLLSQHGEVDMTAPQLAYKIPQDKINYVNKELDDLENVENEIELSTINFSDIRDKELSVSCMDALYPVIIDGEV